MATGESDSHNPQNSEAQNPPPIRQPARYRTAFQFAPDDNFNPFQTPQRPGFGPAHWNPPLGPPQTPTHPPPQRPMPSRNDRSAPKFDGYPPSLRRFFDEIDYLGNSSGLAPAEKIQHTLRYLEFREYETWRTCPSSRGTDWEAFKAEITALYPGADEDRKYTSVDLEILVDKQSREPMQSRYQFGDYYRKFVTISDWLLARNEISIRERNTSFFNGFDRSFRDKLTDCLRLKNPDHPLHRPWNMDDINAAAKFLLDSNSASSEPYPYTHSSHYPQPRLDTPAYPTPAPVRETFDMSSFEQLMVSDVFISKLASKLGLGNQGSHSPTSSVPSAERRPRPPRPDGCIGCLDSSHYHQSCPVIADYIARGLCKRDEMKRVVLMDGTLITAQLAPGRCIRERLDNWLKSRGPPTVSTNMVEALTVTSDPAASYSYSPAETSMQDVLLGEVTAAELDELHVLDTFAISTLKKAEDIRKRIGKAINEKPTSGVATRAAVKAGKSSLAPMLSNPAHSQPSSQPPPASMSAPRMQTRYHTPVEDPAIIQRVVERALDTTVMLTQRELLAVSPEVRKIIRNEITGKRVPADSASANILEEASGGDEPVETLIQSATSPPNLIVAKSVVELRTVPVKLEGCIDIDAVLDEGSQVIGLRSDVWEKLGLPIHSNQTMVMQSANKSCNVTKGLLPNLRVTIGNCDFYLQAQVIDGTSYEMLLGRPFLTLAQANTRHFSNGDSHLTLVDPNSQAVITVPTRARNRHPNSPPPNPGF
ncbi:hypothetical protein D9756_009753 [Leucocoprinus leucothites]|uniref:Uncharacterized protein n=1 Tax=Leucocoprinus leucothites TaxID=201217 RepID=A0A8H5CWI1_9AGAR|nr:hypothetical protein D9756_009753 [Leucoagaricus leucothites]